MTNGNITVMFEQWMGGDKQALDQLIPLVYDELKSMARKCCLKRDAPQTIRDTALVHELYFKLFNNHMTYKNRSHFYGVAWTLMERLIENYRRWKYADKREARRVTPDLTDWINHVGKIKNVDQLVAFNQALSELKKQHPRTHIVAVMRVFFGFKHGQIAQELGVCERVSIDEWRFAQAWLKRHSISSPSFIRKMSGS